MGKPNFPTTCWGLVAFLILHWATRKLFLNSLRGDWEKHGVGLRDGWEFGGLQDSSIKALIFKQDEVQEHAALARRQELIPFPVLHLYSNFKTNY